MFAKVKSPVFIDTVHLEFPEFDTIPFKAVLKDDAGVVCCVLETNLTNKHKNLNWNGLNDLPYGIYTLELFKAEDEMSLRMVKRV
jgi:hypothetical protein